PRLGSCQTSVQASLRLHSRHQVGPTYASAFLLIRKETRCGGAPSHNTLDRRSPNSPSASITRVVCAARKDPGVPRLGGSRRFSCTAVTTSRDARRSTFKPLVVCGCWRQGAPHLGEERGSGRPRRGQERQSAVPRGRAARGRSEKVRDSWRSVRVLQSQREPCRSGEFRNELSQLSSQGS